MENKLRNYQAYLSNHVLRLRSDVPVATALSGGVDSCAVALNCFERWKDKSGQKNQSAFVASFPGSVMDENRRRSRECKLFGPGNN